MALINCPECSKSISDAAPACPNCGVPIAMQKESKAAGANLVTVQETSKKFKLHILFSILLIVVGMVWHIAASQNGSYSSFAILLSTAGFFWFLITRARIWWHHK